MKKLKARSVFPPDTQFMGPLDANLPKPRSSAWIKRRVRLKAGLRLYRESLTSPFFSGRAVFGYLTSILGIYFLFALLDDTVRSGRLSQIAVGFLASAVASLIWAVGLAIAMPFRVVKAEGKVGRWTADRFVLHEPKLVLTREWSPSDNGTYQPFNCVEGYPDTLVDYKIEIDGPAERINCAVMGAYYLRPIEAVIQHTRFDLRGRVRLPKDRKLNLICHSLPNSLPAIIRVYILAWEVDPTTQMDYTDVRTQTRFVLRPPDTKIS